MEIYNGLDDGGFTWNQAVPFWGLVSDLEKWVVVVRQV